jgi:type VI secretion system protein ImpA
MINVEDLLKPVASDKPCGEDFTYHPSFQNLETLARGKAETQFSAAEEPEWKQVREAAIDVLTQSKHLGAAVILTQALAKLGGLEGLCDGIAVVRGISEMYWSDLYPRLDPDDNNDPTERLNILNGLSSPRFILLIGGLIACSSPAMGRITLRQILDAREKSEKGTSEGGAGVSPDLKLIEATFRDAGPGPAKVTLGFVDGALSHVQAIENFLDITLGAGRGVNLETLVKALSELKRAVEPYALDGDSAELPAQSAPAGSASVGGSVSARSMSGGIQSRADVIKALDLICDFYRHNEPSSPVPLILQRAQRLVDKDFISIMSDLTPEALQQLQIITGAKTDK